MLDQIKTGTMLIEEDALLPQPLRVQSQPCMSGWRQLEGNGHLEERVSQIGWVFFYEAGEVKATGFGLGGEQATRRAIKHLTKKVKWDAFNSLEVTRVVDSRILGISCVTVSARWRLLGPSLSSTVEETLPSASLFRPRRSVSQQAALAA
jgi:hypothetical protein